MKMFAVSAIVPILMLLVPTITANINASSGSGFYCNSIVGCFADGYELGKEDGKDDYRDYKEHDSECPSNDSLSFCTGYKAGYEVGWGAAKTLGGN